jgi:hypothetical protein
MTCHFLVGATPLFKEQQRAAVFTLISQAKN